MFKYLKYISFTILINLILWNPITAQFRSLAFERFTIENGLSNNSINSIVQTQDGFLWIATNDGLNRFDGQNFKIYKHNIFDSSSLPENYVVTLLASRDGMLWIGTLGGGLSKFNSSNESFIRFDSKEIYDDFVQTIFEDHSGIIWFGTKDGGLSKLNSTTNEIISYGKNSPHFKEIPDDNITSIIEDENHTLWIGTTNSGLLQFDPSSEKFQQFSYDPKNPNSIINNGVWNIFQESKTSLLLSTFYGIDRFDLTTQKFTHYPNIPTEKQSLFETVIRQTIIDKQGRIWVASFDYRGIFLFEKSNADNFKIIRLQKEDDNLQSISNDRIRWIFEDQKNNLWIATEDGLNKLPEMKIFFQYRHFPLRKTSLGGRIVNNIFENKNNILWVGIGGGGFDKIDLSNQKISHFKNDPKNPNSLISDDVTSVYEDKNGILWIGTSNAGLDSYNPSTKKFSHFTHDENNKQSIGYNWVQVILETKDEKFLVGTNQGIDILDRKQKTFQPFAEAMNIDPKSLPLNISTNALYEDREGNIWIGTWLDGLFCYLPKTKQVKHFLPEKNNPFSLNSNRVVSIFEDSDGSMWIGTYGGGLNKFDTKSGKFFNFSKANGILNDVVFGITEDANGFLWISTMKGLVKFNPKTESIRLYDEADGIVNNQFHLHSYFKNQNGIMYFGGINGFVSFHPDSIKVDSVTPKVVITSFKIFNKEANIHQSLAKNNEIELEQNQNFFSINFTVLDLSPRYKNNYAYMLEGNDPEWTYSGIRSTVYYTNVQEGTYRFLVKASNADGVWGEPISLSIIILPAWWLSWWFKIIIIFFIVGVGILIYQYRVKRLIEIERIRFNISNDLHDEIGSNLSSISVDSQTLMQSKTLTKMERELTSDISKTSKETVEAMRDIIWFINPKNDVGEDIIFKMKETAAKLLIGIQWSYNVASDVRFDLFDLEVRRNIFLIYKESLTNVLKHSKSKNCNIDITKKKNNIIVQIKDDGIGFDLKNVKKNNGLLNLRHRANKIGAEIDIKSKENKGTIVELTVPLKN